MWQLMDLMTPQDCSAVAAGQLWWDIQLSSPLLHQCFHVGETQREKVYCTNYVQYCTASLLCWDDKLLFFNTRHSKQEAIYRMFQPESLHQLWYTTCLLVYTFWGYVKLRMRKQATGPQQQLHTSNHWLPLGLMDKKFSKRNTTSVQAPVFKKILLADKSDSHACIILSLAKFGNTCRMVWAHRQSQWKGKNYCLPF